MRQGQIVLKNATHPGLAALLGLGLLLALSGLAGCSSPTEAVPEGDLQTPTEAVSIGELVFFSSPKDDGLKVAYVAGSVAGSCLEDADCGGGQRCTDSECVRSVEEILRAPQPLFSLLVPALRVPTQLTAIEAGPGSRPLLVVASAVDPQLRVIDAEALVPVGRGIALPGRAIGIVALPAEKTLLVAVQGPDLLDGATSPPEGDELVEVRLEDETFQPGASLGRGAGQVVARWPLQARISSLASSSLGGGQVFLSVADAPKLIRFTRSDGSRVEQPIPEPLLRLEASPAVTDEAGLHHEQGERLFGLSLDGRRLFAFDGLTGQIAQEQQDAAGAAYPVRFPSSVADFALGDLSPFLFSGQETPISLLFPIVAAGLDGAAYMVDGGRGLAIEADGDFEAIPSVVSLSPEESDRSAPHIARVTDPKDPGASATVLGIGLSAGVTRTRSWSIAYRPIVALQSDIEGQLASDGARLLLRPTRRLGDVAARLKVGDELELLAAPAACGEISKIRYQLLAVTPAVSSAEQDSLELGPLGDAPVLADPACASEPIRYAIRASAFVITASGLPDLLRAKPGETLSVQGAAFRAEHADGPELLLELDADQSGVVQGATRVIAISSGGDPLRIESNSVLGSNARSPGRPALFTVSGQLGKSVSTGRAYLPFPGANAVFGFDLETGGSPTLLR